MRHGINSLTGLIQQRASLEDPAIPLSSPQAFALLAGLTSTDSGIMTSEFTVMRQTAIWRCISLIAGTIASCPLNLWQGDPSSPYDRQPYLGAQWNSTDYGPNPEVSGFEFWETAVTSLLLWGNCYLLPVLNNGGDKVVQVWQADPWRMYASRHDASSRGIPGTKYYRLQYGSGLELDDSEVVHIPGLGFDGIRGLSPVAYLKQSIGLGIAMEQYAARLFGSGSLMSGLLTTDKPLTPDQADAVKSRWRDKITGLNRAHEVVVLDNSLKYTPIGINPIDSQLIEARAFSVEECCRIYGVPVHLVSATEKISSWGTGIAEMTLGFQRFTLQPIMTRFQARITKELCPKGVYAEFDTRELLKGDQVDRYAAANYGINGGFITRNEVRKWEHMAPGPPELDVFQTPGTLLPPLVPIPPAKSPKGV